MKTSLLVLGLVSFPFLSKTQIIGTEAFLKGNFVEVGIAGDGGYEGANTPDSSYYPAGMHYRSNNPYFGFTANPAMDGWVNYDGDFYTPGSPENGWGLEIIDSTYNVTLVNNRSSLSNHIHGAITSHTYTGGITTVIWQGHIDTLIYSLDVNIKYELHDTALYYKTTTTIVNTGSSTIDELYYYRNIDPDNNVTLSSDYVTTNTIVSQPTGSSSIACVKAEQTLPWASIYALWTNDSTARATYGGFSNRDASDIWNATGGLTGTVSSVSTADEAISMAFKTSNLSDTATAPLRTGLHSSVSFKVYSAFSSAALSSLMSSPSLSTQEIADEKLFLIYPNPANNQLNIIASKNIIRYQILTTSGKTILQSDVRNTSSTVDISSLKPGLYLVKIETDEKTSITKLVKR